MRRVLGVPTTTPVNVATFVFYVLPPLLFHFVMAVMAVTPRTRTLRLALWPLSTLLAWRAAVSVVIVYNESDPPMSLTYLMFFMATRSLHWALAKDPLVRRFRPPKSTPSALADALDLVVSFRGHGWDWSQGLHVPPETRPSDRMGFAFHVALSTAVHAFACGILYRALRSFTPLGLGSVVGGSIFDASLPWHLQYSRSSIIAVLGCLASYAFLQGAYDFYTLLAVLVLGQDPSQWPPGFDAPWRATSLTEFWGRRWHQWFRHIFLVQGGYPLSLLFGRTGFVVGAFLSSAVVHHVGLYSLDPSSAELSRMLLGFGMMAPGVLAEGAFRRYTGRKVGGIAGWIWTMTWLVLWGNFIIDGFVRAALFRSGALVDLVPPLRRAVECLVMGFDTWLHAIQA